MMSRGNYPTPISPLTRYGRQQTSMLTLGRIGRGAIAGGRLAANLYNRFKNSRRRPRSAKRRRLNNSTTRVEEKFPGEVNKENIKLRLNKNKIPKLVAPGTMEILQTFQGTASSGAGSQNVNRLFALGSIAQVNTSTGVGYSDIQAPISYWGINPFEGRAAGTIYGASTNITNDATFLRSFQIKMLLTNFSSTPAIVQIYILMSKKYTAQSPESLFNTGFSDDANGQPSIVLPTGGVAGTRGYPNNSYPFIGPNKDFTQYYKILKRKDILLSNTSSTEEITMYINCNQIITKDKLAAAAVATPGAFFRPGTVILMTVTKGSTVMQDATVGATGGVTLAPSKFGYIAYCKTNLRQMKGRNALTDTIIGASQVNTNAAASLLSQIENTTLGQDAENYEQLP